MGLQRYHNQQVQEVGKTTMPNQGIRFDHKNRPMDIVPGQDFKMDGFRPTGGRGQSIGKTVEKKERKGKPKWIFQKPT